MPEFEHSTQNEGFYSVRKNRHTSLTRIFKLAFVLFYLVIQQGVYLLAFEILFRGNALPSSYQAYISSLPVIVVVTLVCIDLFGMTHFYRKTSVDLIVENFKLTALVTLSMTFFAFFFSYFTLPRTMIALSSILMFVILSLLSIIALKISYLVYKKGKLVIIAANQADARKLIAKSKYEMKKLRLEFAGWADHHDTAEILKKIRESTEVLVSMNVDDDVKSKIILLCAEKSKTVYMVPQFYELAYSRFRVVQFYDTPTFMIDSFGLTFQQRLYKRILDVVVAVIMIIVTMPVQIVLAIAIRLDSRGPIFYTQERNTINSRIYNVIKFRSMVDKAESNYGAFQSGKDDPRLTKMGKFMRNTHLDELPQFYNVIKGDMSVVGPRSDRPITINEFEQRIPGYDQRLKVKSGITGLAQVMGKYNTDPEDKLRYDMIYMKNYSLLLDIKIMFMTVGAMLPSSNLSLEKDESDYLMTSGK